MAVVAPPSGVMPTQVTPAIRPAPATQVTPPEPAPATQLWPSESGTTQQQHSTATTPQNAPPQPYGNAPSYQQPSYQPQPMSPSPGYPASSAGGGLQQNMAGLLCYMTFIPAIIFLVLEPYNRNRFIRFHAFQCLFLTAASFIINIVASVITWMLPSILGFVFSLLTLIIPLAFFVIWIFVVIKAYNNEMYKLPIIGDLAEQQAGR